MAANWPLIERCNFDSNDGLWHYDLSAFYYLFEDEEIQDYRGALYEYDFEMQVCGAVRTPFDSGCQEGRGAICGYNSTSNGTYLGELGSWSILPQPVWSMADPADPMIGAILTYNNGVFLDRTEEVTVTVHLPCDPVVEVMAQDFELTETHMLDSFVVTMAASKYACPQQIVQPALVGPISAGSVFLAM